MSIFRGMVLLALVFLTACATPIIVNSDYAQGTNFSQYKTYRWHDAGNLNLSADEFLSSEFIDGRLHAYVDTVLRDKGYIYREQGSVDLLVSYKISSELRQRLYSYGGSPAWGVGVLNRHDHIGYGVGLHSGARVSSEYFQYASLVLDFVKANDQLLVWRGQAEMRMPAEQSAEKWRESIRKIVDALLEDFHSHY